MAGVALLWLAALLCCGAHVALPSEPALQMAFVLFRHGHRNIMQAYEFDPYSNASYWPGGIGQITTRGKKQMYDFGQRLRERYSDLLSDQYSADEVLVRSSSSPRCITSALCVLAGLFPPTGDEVWNPNILWQPVPLHAPEEGHDKLIRMDAPCPAYRREWQRQMDSPDIREFNSNYSDVYRIIGEHWKPVSDFEAPNNLHDHFTIEVERGFPLPNWTRDIYPDKLLEISNQYHVFRTYSTLMTRLKMGPVVKDMVQRMLAKRNSTQPLGGKLYLYAVHDDALTGLLHVLGRPNRFKMRYGAAMFLELYADPAGTHIVKVFFMRDTDVGQIESVETAGCGTVCDLDTFAGLMAPIMPSDWDKECQLNDTVVR